MYSNKMSAFFVAILSALVGSLSSAASSLTNNVFSLQAENAQSLAIGQSFSENSKTDVVAGTTIPCALKAAIYGASVDAKITLFGEASVARVILIDNANREYMIYEINSLLANTKTFSVKNVCHETKLLNGINPQSIRIDLLAASLELQNVSFVTTIPFANSEFSTLQNQIMEAQHQQRIDLYNKQIKLKGEEWTAGRTEISMKTYQEKKSYFLGGENNPLPNTQGTEYYVGGVMPVRTNTSDQISSKNLPSPVAYADTFDWRNRHGATLSTSPYFNSARYGNINGWITPIRNQGSCGSCWIHSAVGDAEQKVNLYYNRHIDFDLSEQQMGACVAPGAMCSGGWPVNIEKYISTKGVVDEAACPYKASNTVKCGDTSATPKEHVYINAYKELKTTEIKTFDDLKKCIIKYGPLAGVDMSMSHAMAIVGYRSSGNIIIYKNSWGGVGDAGYLYRAFNFSQGSWTAFICKTPASIVTKEYADDSIRCVDMDHDGYYNWGIGPKPNTCPNCPDEEDCDDNNPKLGPYEDSTGKCRPIIVGIVATKLPNSHVTYNYTFEPLRRAVTIRFEAPATAVTSVQMYSLSGMLMKTLTINSVEKGLQKAVWNCTNEAGMPIHVGIYVCRISIDNDNAKTIGSFKIAVSR